MFHVSEHSAHPATCDAHRKEHDLRTRVQAEFREMPGLQLTPSSGIQTIQHRDNPL